MSDVAKKETGLRKRGSEQSSLVLWFGVQGPLCVCNKNAQSEITRKTEIRNCLILCFFFSVYSHFHSLREDTTPAN